MVRFMPDILIRREKETSKQDRRDLMDDRIEEMKAALEERRHKVSHMESVFVSLSLLYV